MIIPQHSRSSVSGPPPPPPREAEDGPLNPWVTGHQAHSVGNDNANQRESPARSESSQHTLAGSDFNTELTNVEDKVSTDKNVIDAKEKAGSGSSTNTDGNLSRKRSHAESATENTARQDEDNSPRSSKRRHPQVDAAYR